MLQGYSDRITGALNCEMCRLSVKGLDIVLRSTAVLDLAEFIAIKVCSTFIEKNDTVCPGAVNMMTKVILPVLSDSVLGADVVCAQTLEVCSSPKYEKLYLKDFVDRVLSEKPSHILDNDYLNKIYREVGSSPRKTITAVQISDPHMDLLYTPGMDT